MYFDMYPTPIRLGFKKLKHFQTNTHTHIRGSFGGVLRMRYSAGIMFHQTPLKAGFISESCLS